MKRIFLPYFLCGLVFLGNTVLSYDNPRKSKIVALVPGHNDSRFLKNCFKALAKYADAIVYLDDASTDNSIAIAKELAEECHIEKIICKQEWIRNAAADRNTMLQAGREIDGTHFITIDADEMFTANCLDDAKLRMHILNLKPGERLALTWIQLWRSPDRYRYDDSVWTNRYMNVAFCDDGTCSHHPRRLCESRTPDTLSGMTWLLEGYTYGLLHFQFVNFDNLLRKQAWYRCQEHVLDKKRSFSSINSEYHPSRDEAGLRTVPTPTEWFKGYDDFLNLDMLIEKEYWREQEAMNWFITHGLHEFVGLDIWDTQWPFTLYQNKNSSFLDTFVFQEKKNGVIVEIGTPIHYIINPVEFLQKERGWQIYSLHNKNSQLNTKTCTIETSLAECILDKTEKIAVWSTETNKIVQIYDAKLKDKVAQSIEPFQNIYRYILKEFPKNAIHDLEKIDLLVVHEYSSLIDSFMRMVKFDHFNVQVIGTPTEYVSTHLKTLAEQNGFCLVPYDDNGYSYFLKRRYQ